MIPTESDFALVDQHVLAMVGREGAEHVPAGTRRALAFLCAIARFKERDTLLALVEKHCCQCKARAICSELLAGGEAVRDPSGAIIGFTQPRVTP